jgi:hypothetical protein
MKVCKVSGRTFDTTPEEEKIYAEFALPTPDTSQEERVRRLLSFRNDRKFFWRSCSKTEERIYSIYPTSVLFPVYRNEIWLQTDWSPFSFGAEYDLKIGFLEQLYLLWKMVPRPASSFWEGSGNVLQDNFNSENNTFLFESVGAKNAHYSMRIKEGSDLLDCYFVTRSSRCYKAVDCHDSNNIRWSEHSYRCRDSAFLADCVDCKNCLFCVGLRGREYCIWNEQLSAAEYQRQLEQLDLSSRRVVDDAKERFSEFLKEKSFSPWFFFETQRSTGNALVRTNNCNYAFECVDSEDVFIGGGLSKWNGAVEVFGIGENGRQVTHSVGVGHNAFNVSHSIDCSNAISDLEYCFNCYESKNLFGCVGLRHAEYCVLNRQYAKEEYFKVVAEIVKNLQSKRLYHKPLNIKFSPFPYNLSAAYDFFPLTKVQADMLKYSWDDKEEHIRPRQLLGGKISESLDHITDIDQSELFSSVFLCELSGKPFQISPAEYDLCHLLNVPPPIRAFEQRYKDHLFKMGNRVLLKRKDSLSGEEFSSCYAEKSRYKITNPK